MPSLMEDVIKQVREGLSVIGERTERYTKMGRLRIDMVTIERQIDRAFTELGRRVHQLITEQPNFDIANDDEVRKALAKIRDLQTQRDEKKRELERLGKRSPSGRQEHAAAATSG